MTPRRRRALEALVARGATPGEREAARVALAKADAAARPAAAPSGPRTGGAGFTIHGGKVGGFDNVTITFDGWAHGQGQEFWERMFTRGRAAPQASPPKPPGPFGDGSPGPGPKKCTPKPPRFEPRPCTFMYTAEMVEDHLSPTDDQTFLVRDLKPLEGPEYKTKGTPVILLVGKAEFGARCVHWDQQNPGGPILAYFERLTCDGRLEAAGTIDGDLLVEMTEARATALARGLALHLVTHGGRTWICRCLGPDEGGGRFSKVDKGPAR